MLLLMFCFYWRLKALMGSRHCHKVLPAAGEEYPNSKKINRYGAREIGVLVLRSEVQTDSPTAYSLPDATT